MNYEQLEVKLRNFGRDIITPNFLESVERWSRYKGERLISHNVSIEDMGIFTKTTEIPKLIWDENGVFTCSTTETEKVKTKYDVSLIHNSTRCTDHCNIVVISERNDFSNRPRDLFIYSVANGKGTRLHPSFRKLKKDFQSQCFKPYQSLIYNFCGVYTIVPYNENTDRFFNYTSIFSDLEQLDHEFKSIAKNIKVSKREKNIFKK